MPVVLDQKRPGRSRFGRRQERLDVRPEGGDDLVDQPPGVALAGGRAERLDLADCPKQSPRRLLTPSQAIPFVPGEGGRIDQEGSSRRRSTPSS